MEKFDRVADSHTKILTRQSDFSATGATPGTKTAVPFQETRIQSLSDANSGPPAGELGGEDLQPPPPESEIAEEELRLELMSQKRECYVAKQPYLEAATAAGEDKTQPYDVTPPPQKSPIRRTDQHVQRNSSVKCKQEFSAPQGKPEIESKDVTPKKQKHCSCKNSKCLKLYCECFASGTYCNGCNCLNCHNNLDNEAARQEAVGVILERNPRAFKPKIAGSPHGIKDSQDDEHKAHILGKHNKGCNCKKSRCLKKYCECYQADILCSENCTCQDCKNFEGSEERTALLHGYQNSVSFIKQAANEAINGAVGFSGFMNTTESRKRKSEEVPHIVQYQQGNHFPRNGPTPLFPVPNNRVVSVSPKSTYRSPLADAIQPHHVKELCSILVSVSMDVPNNFSGGSRETDKRIEKDSMKHYRYASPDIAIDVLRGEDQAATKGDGSVPYQPDTGDERHLSPATRALMCDEDRMIISKKVAEARVTETEEKQEAKANYRDSEFSGVYAEKERHVLANFRDFLARLITYGSIKEKMSCTLARCERRSKYHMKIETAMDLSSKEPEDGKQSHENAVV
ncbi:PREDICTED: protein tesmin/TSO1-like CXC 7 [Tarenaya hassleriana]|uniref:protein tesmin/TSO1-like CXC 7 n=1 Tax=Tarenaya hassleriana TaxID=28532 RepID=UPI00053C7549|nr:PREDICTED: protein tesmin/TSO1-like CXC 7 [Tarenaya hassleriana]